MLVELITLFVVPVSFCTYKEFKMNLGLTDRHWKGTRETLTEIATDGALLAVK
jgi:Cu(I)/Ag(I) efflux system membrane protein CusA/SilA